MATMKELVAQQTGTAAEIAAVLNTVSVTRNNPAGTVWSNKGIDAAFPDDYLSGQVALGLEGAVSAMRAAADQYEQANDLANATANRVAARTFEGYISTMESVGLDFANAALRAQLDTLQGMGALTSSCVTKLKSMGIQSITPCEAAGLAAATEQSVQAALDEIANDVVRAEVDGAIHAVQSLYSLTPSTTREQAVMRFVLTLIPEKADAVATALEG